VLIQPELGDISSGSFDRMAEGVRIGEAAARSQADQLRRYKPAKAEYDALRSGRSFRARDKPGRIDEIRFEGIERNELRGAGAADGHQARRRGDRGFPQSRPAPHLRTRRLSTRWTTASRKAPARAR